MIHYICLFRYINKSVDFFFQYVISYLFKYLFNTIRNNLRLAQATVIPFFSPQRWLMAPFQRKIILSLTIYRYYMVEYNIFVHNRLNIDWENYDGLCISNLIQTWRKDHKTDILLKTTKNQSKETHKSPWKNRWELNHSYGFALSYQSSFIVHKLIK